MPNSITGKSLKNSHWAKDLQNVNADVDFSD